jgi:PleD family two-component response regulator
MDIIFPFTIFDFSSDLQSKFELSEEIQLNEQNIIVIANTFIIVPKMEHVSLHSVGTNHKRFGSKKKKMEINFAECPNKTLDKTCFAECRLDRHSAKYILKILKKSLPSVC